jgi:hypothetical protein
MLPNMVIHLNNLFPAPKPATQVRAKIMQMEYSPIFRPGDTRSTPRPSDTAGGSYRPYSGATELPVPMHSSGISFEAVAEPRNVPTAEPKSPV